MSTAPLPWNAGAEGLEDVCGFLELRQNPRTTSSVWVELDNIQGTVRWFEREASRRLSVSAAARSKQALKSSKKVKTTLRISDMKGLRHALDSGSSMSDWMTPTPKGTLRVGARTHLQCRTEEDEADAQEALHRGDHTAASSGNRDAWALVVVSGTKALYFVAPSAEAFGAWRRGLAAVAGALNGGRSATPAFAKHLLHRCAVCEDLSTSANAAAASNERRAAARRAQQAAVGAAEGGNPSGPVVAVRQCAAARAVGCDDEPVRRLARARRAIDFAWGESYEAFLAQQPGASGDDSGERRGAESDGEPSSTESDGSGDARSVQRNLSVDTSFGSSAAGSADGSQSSRLTAWWCPLCGCPVASMESRRPHLKACARRRAATTAPCPTCRWPVKSI